VPLQLDTIEAFAAGRLSRREFMRRAAILGLSMGSITAIVAACGGTPSSAGASAAASAGASAAGSAAASAAGSAVTGGTMRVAAQKPVKVDPVAMQDLGGYGITSQSFEFLCALTPKNLVDIGPGLAQVDPNADGRVDVRPSPERQVAGRDTVTAAPIVATMERPRPPAGLRASLPGRRRGENPSRDVHLLGASGNPYLVSVFAPRLIT
jgi:hypothetical protein